MTATTYPRWVGTASMPLAGKRILQGAAHYVTAPGVVTRVVKCSHHHRALTTARACGERMAASRNARRRS